MAAEDLERLADFVGKLDRYFSTVMGAIGFFVFGISFGGYWLIIYSVATIWGPRVWGWGALGSIAIIAIGIISLRKALPKIYARGGSGSGFKLALSFVLSFTITYLIIYVVSDMLQPSMIEWYLATAWYPALGLAFLLIHILIERELFVKRIVLAKPFLLASILILITYPLILYMYYVGFLESAWILTLGLMLLIYFTVGIYALHRASKIFA